MTERRYESDLSNIYGAAQVSENQHNAARAQTDKAFAEKTLLLLLQRLSSATTKDIGMHMLPYEVKLLLDYITTGKPDVLQALDKMGAAYKKTPLVVDMSDVVAQQQRIIASLLDTIATQVETIRLTTGKK